MPGPLEDLRKENAFFRRIVESAADSIVAVDGSGRITLSNESASRVFGYSPGEFPLLPASALFPPEGPGAAALALGDPWIGEVLARRKDGATFPAQMTLSHAPVPHAASATEAGGPVARGAQLAPENWIILQIRDVTDQERMLARLKQLSILDDLTGLYNARYFWARLRYEFVRSIRYQQPLSCLMADLDRFKRVNDEYGHLSGDSALKFVSKIMFSSIREVDILSRYGGEEFAIILPNTAEAGALKCADKIRLAVAQSPLAVGGVTIRLTASLGVAGLAPEISNEEQLARRADEALLQAKRLGRNRICLWSSECPKTDLRPVAEPPAEA